MANNSFIHMSAALSDLVNKVTENCEEYLSSNKKDKVLKQSLKNIYDYIYADKHSQSKSALPELIIDSFTHEEIWPQIELHNNDNLLDYVTNVSNLVTLKNNFLEATESNSDKNSDSDSQQSVSNDKGLSKNDSNDIQENVENQKFDTDTDESSQEEDTQNKSNNLKNNADSKQLKIKKSIVDDDFFKLNEMENFLKSEEKRENRSVQLNVDKDSSDSEDGSVDMFAPLDDEDINADNIKYSDFFDPSKNDNELSEEENSEACDSDSDKDEVFHSDDNESAAGEENVNKNSNLEMREARLKRQIEDLENEALTEKPWQLKGETEAKLRPEDSLLQEYLEFDVSAKPAVVVTEKTNLCLEDIIRKRIEQRVWDSVKRKVKPTEEPQEFKKRLALDQEKSKESLAQIYEKEYIKQRETLNSENTETAEERSEEKIACTAAVDNLFMNLDALSHFYFTPKLVKPEVKIISNLPAINMEEVAPVATSAATLLAPEEVSRKSKAPEMAKEERTVTDKKRERRKKKKIQKIRAKTSKQGNNNDRNKLLTDVTKDQNISQMKISHNNILKSSETFFRMLQDQSKEDINSKLKKRKNDNKPNMSAKKIKL